MYRIRPLHDTDREAYAQLLRESPDTGRVQFARHFLIDPITAVQALHPDALVAVAEHDNGQLGGTGTVSFGSLCLQDQVLPSAYLSALAVHPAHQKPEADQTH